MLCEVRRFRIVEEVDLVDAESAQEALRWGERSAPSSAGWLKKREYTAGYTAESVDSKGEPTGDDRAVHLPHLPDATLPVYDRSEGEHIKEHGAEVTLSQHDEFFRAIVSSLSEATYNPQFYIERWTDRIFVAVHLDDDDAVFYLHFMDDGTIYIDPEYRMQQEDVRVLSPNSPPPEPPKPHSYNAEGG